MFTIGCLSIIDPHLEKETAGRLSRFADWFEERFFIPRVIADPEVAQIAGVVISAFINDAARRRYESSDHEQVARLGNSLLYEHMPDILKAHVKLDRNVMEWIGMRADCVAIEGVGFDHSEFSRAVEDIMGGAPNADIRALDSEAEYTLKRMSVEDGIPVVGVFVRGAEDGPVWRIKDEILAMASPDSAAREVSLRAHRRWLDCDREKFEQAIREINGIEDLMTRMRKVQDWRDESAEVHYSNFAYKLGRTHAFQWAELIPSSAEGLLRHYRLSADMDADSHFSDALERSARTLLDEEGVETALERLARLPVIIPDALAQELGSLADEERSAILEGCASRWASPVGKLNLAHIILRFPSQNGALTRVALSAIEGLFDEEGKSGFDLFKALLDFTYDRFSLWKEVQAWGPSLKLAMVWAHAVRLYDVFHLVSGPAATAELAKAFEAYNRDRGSINIMRRQTSLWNDALHPRRFSKAVLLTHGVASILAGASVAEPDKLRVRDRIMSVSSASPENSNLVPLLCDYTRGSNWTNSYLGGNHEAISRIIGDDTADHLAPSKLEGMALEVIQKLKDDAAGRDWCTLEILSMELPFRPEVSSQLNALIEKTDYLALFERDQRDALSALRVAINQAYYTNDEKLRSRIEEVLFSCMKSAFCERDGNPISPAESGDTSGSKQTQGLTDIAFRLALRESDQRATVANFSRLMVSFIRTCPSASAYFDAGMSQFLRPLPAEGLQEMWRFWLTVRAS